jgi:hypothetical protein
MLYSAPVTNPLINTPLDGFVDLVAFSRWTLSEAAWSFFHSFQHIWQGLRRLFASVQAEKERCQALE